MNKLKFLVLSLVMVFFTSCQFSENIYINEDGSGKMEFSFDGSELMVMAGDEMAKDGEEAVDSVMSFKDMLYEKRDSISKLPKEEQEKLKALEPFSVRTLMNPETKEMKINMFADFKNVSELQNMFETLSKVQDFDNSKAPKQDNPFNMNSGNTKLSYTFDGKTFTRSATIVDRDIHKMAADSLSKMSMMFTSSKYKLNYHFPRPIKSVSNDKAMFSGDRKSVTIEFGFMDYATDPESLNLTIVLED